MEALCGCADRRQTGCAGAALLQAEERGVAAAAAQQIVVLAALDDLAGLDHQDGVGVHDGVEAVGDDDGGAVPAEMLDGFLHGFLGFRIQRRARATAMRWRWPPDSCVPCSPTGVS